MLCVWWCSTGIVHYELLETGEMVNAELTTVMKKLRALSGRTTSRFRPLLLHDNASPHTAKMTKTKLEELWFEVLPHSPYSPDLAPSDFCLFRSLQHHIRDMEFKTFEEVQNAVEEFSFLKNSRFLF